MKKSLLLLMVLLLSLSLCLFSCGGKDNDNDGDTNQNENVNPDENKPEEKPAHSHKFGEWITVKNPTCVENGERERSCECGEKQTETIAPTIEHNYSTEYNFDEASHWLECKDCGASKDMAEHQLSGDSICAVCNMMMPTEGIVYQISDDGKHAIVIEYTGSEANIRIADTYQGLPVKNIYDKAFYKNETITSVIIPDSVVTIGAWAFKYCPSLTSINVDENNNNYKSIDGNLYSKDGKTLIQYAIGKQDESFTIPLEVTSIGEYAFSDCSSLTSVIIDDDVITIGDGAFYCCYYLTSVVIGNSVTYIGDGAFYCCSSLTSVVIPDSVTSIGGGAFEYCTSLTSVIIDDGVITIGDGAFYGCSSLTSINVDEKNNNYKSIDGNLYSKDGKTLIQYAIGKQDESFTIPLEVTTIADSAFQYCYSLTSVVIGDSVTSIGNYAFYGCSSLTSVVIPDSVTSIGECAFYSCSKLQFNEYENCKYLGSKDNPYFALIKVTTQNLSSYTIHKDTKVIASGAFEYCTSLTSVVIPDNVITVGNYAFYGCSSLSSVVIGNSVKTIGRYVFSSCSNLTSVVIPDSVTSIGDSAFWNCSRLTSINVDEKNNNYKSIDGNLYSKDGKTLIQYAIGKQDESFTIPLEVKTIGDSAFWNCSGLTSVVIPDSVTTIGNSAFYGCSKLQFNEYENCKYLGSEDNPYLALIRVTTQNLSSYTIHEDTKVIAGSAFQYCSSLTSVVIPNSVTSIGDYAFHNCSSLSSVVIGNSVKTIGRYVFSGCYNLTSVVIGNSVTTIDDSAFRGCSALSDVYYTGSEEEWKQITIDYSNYYLTGAKIHYNHIP